MKIVARVRKYFRGKEGKRFFRRRIYQYVEERTAQPDAVHGSTYGLAADRS